MNCFYKNVLYLCCMIEYNKRNGMVSWDDNYIIIDVMSIGCGERFWVKFSTNHKWEQRNFYSKKRVISFCRSLLKTAGSELGVVLLQHLYKVLDGHQVLQQHA